MVFLCHKSVIVWCFCVKLKVGYNTQSVYPKTSTQVSFIWVERQIQLEIKFSSDEIATTCTQIAKIPLECFILKGAHYILRKYGINVSIMHYL